MSTQPTDHMQHLTFYIFRKNAFTRLFCLGWLALFVLNTASAQNSGDSEFKIVDLKLNNERRQLEVHVKAVKNGISIPLKQDEPRFNETIGSKNQWLEVDTIVHKIVEQKNAKKTGDTLNVLFLIEAVSAIAPEMAAKRQGLIQRVIQELNSGASSSNFYISSYGDRVSKPVAADLAKIESTLNDFDGRSDSYAELYQGLVEVTRFTRERKGKWVIFVFTDGFNKENTVEYSTEAPYNKSDALYFLSKLNLGAFLIPIGIGDTRDDAFLQEMVQATGNPSDTFAINAIPTGLYNQVARKIDIAYNNIIYLFPPTNPIFMGEKRVYAGKWVGGPLNHSEASYPFIEGTPQNPIILGDARTGQSWLLDWFLGLLAVGGVLGVLAIAVPNIDRENFRKKYVRRYRKEAGIVKSDPLTGEPFREGELVVVKCPRQMTSLETWNYVGHKCPNYSKCLEYAPPCNGAGAPSDTDHFFKGKGVFRRLNWVWFGMVGGFIAWTIYAIFKYFGMEWYNELLYEFSGRSFGDGLQSDRFIRSLADDTLLGAAFGAGICFTLSWAEERGQPRKMSWLRVFMRTFIGLIISLLVFLLGFYLQFKGYVPNLTLSGLLTWMMFGLAIGAVLSVESSVTLLRGLWGGFIASVLAYGFYILIGAFGGADFALAKLFSFILLGAILGLTLVTVITRLEDFELEYLSPEMFRQVNPISKWLKNRTDVFIGREQGNYVYVKWEDAAVEPFHARLFYDRGVVYLEPLAETLLNGKSLPLRSNNPLRNGDVIQLGRESITRMRYREKRQTVQNQSVHPAPGPYSDVNSGGKKYNS
jgi:hypothetical protein